jgi:hypothetical protein
MASQNPLDRPGGLTAAADLSSAQYLFVKPSGEYGVDVCSVAGEFAIGVLQNKPVSGGAATVECTGVTKLVAGEALAAGDLVGTDANGKGKVVEATATGADVGEWAFGVCLEPAGADEVASVKLGINHLVTA